LELDNGFLIMVVETLLSYKNTPLMMKGIDDQFHLEYTLCPAQILEMV